jgi:protein O-GlcNAc transferase
LSPGGNIDDLLQRARQAQRGGRAREAEQLFRQALLLKPRNAEAIQELGILLFQTGQTSAALAEFERAVAVDPDSAAACNNLGIVLQAAGQFDRAIDIYRKSIQRHPRMPQLAYNLGVALQAAGQADEAIAAFEQALAQRPDYAEAYNNLAAVLIAKGELDRAITTYQRLLALAPNLAAGHNNLGEALRKKGRMEEAIAEYRRAIALDPKFADAPYNLGIALRATGRTAEAIASYRQALSIKPDSPEAWANLANALSDLHDPDQAAEACRKAIQLRPNYPEAINNLGNALRQLGRLPEADDCFRRAVELAPTDADYGSNRIFSFYYFQTDPQPILREAIEFDKRHARPLSHLILSHENDRDPDRRLRVGYVSPDFCRHAISFFTIPLFANHDHAQFELFAYSTVRAPDELTRQIAGHFDAWRECQLLTDEQIADQIRQDRIDILVDLSLHSAAGRPLVFARKLAPVQIAYLAYTGTTGMQAMDYRLTDPFLDPPGQTDGDSTEQSIRLPETTACYDPLAVAPAVNDLPAATNGHITFGCLNSTSKMNEATLRRWAAVLDAVPRSRMLVLTPPGSARNVVSEILGANRVEFVPHQPRDEYLRTYHRIDLGLDTFPYNGHTTSLDSIWMGVPVVTRVGQTVVGRAGWSQVSNLELTDLAGRDDASFVQAAVRWAGDLGKLSDLRASLRQRLTGSPLMNAPRFARHVESAYRDAWRTWAGRSRKLGA